MAGKLMIADIWMENTWTRILLAAEQGKVFSLGRVVKWHEHISIIKLRMIRIVNALDVFEVV